jgi:predicted permease
MSAAIFLKLVALFAVIGGGFVAGRTRAFMGPEPVRALSNAAFLIFTPALLFRTTARIDFSTLPVRTLAAFFVPTFIVMLLVYLQQRLRSRPASVNAAGPASRGVTSSFGNTVQLGIPMATALFGEAGLSIHIAIVSVHALVILVVMTALAELDLAHAQGQGGNARPPLLATLLSTARNTVIHPVVLPVLVGLSWNLLGLPIPKAIDEVLLLLSQAVVPLCLVLIGLALSHYGVRGAAQGAIMLSVVKLFIVPATALGVAHWGFGLSGEPLAVVVMCAALPAGSNTLLFAQRYGVHVAEATATIVFSTAAFVVTAMGWIALLHWMG